MCAPAGIAIIVIIGRSHAILQLLLRLLRWRGGVQSARQGGLPQGMPPGHDDHWGGVVVPQPPGSLRHSLLHKRATCAAQGTHSSCLMPTRRERQSTFDIALPCSQLRHVSAADLAGAALCPRLTATSV